MSSPRFLTPEEQAGFEQRNGITWLTWATIPSGPFDDHIGGARSIHDDVLGDVLLFKTFDGRQQYILNSPIAPETVNAGRYESPTGPLLPPIDLSPLIWAAVIFGGLMFISRKVG